MHPIKYIWALRALIYKPFFKRVGNLTYIGKPLFIEGCKKISIGNRTRIFPNVRIEAIGNGQVVIGDNCAIEQNVHITAGTLLKIENDVTIAADTFVTSLDHDYKDINKSVMEQEYLFHETVIGQGSFLGYGVAIQAGTHLGKHCIVGMHSVVKGNFPDYSVIVGCPARIVKKYNVQSGQWENVDS